jgi:hypothetical protein
MSFRDELYELYQKAWVKAKQTYEADINHRLLIHVIDGIDDAQKALCNQASWLKQEWVYQFEVDIEDIQQQHQAYLTTLPAGESANKDLDMVKGLLTRRLPSEFSGMDVAFAEREHTLVFIVSGSL